MQPAQAHAHPLNPAPGTGLQAWAGAWSKSRSAAALKSGARGDGGPHQPPAPHPVTGASLLPQQFQGSELQIALPGGLGSWVGIPGQAGADTEARG